MKTVIAGKRYDTETARQVGSAHGQGLRGDFRCYEESLYTTERGAWFTYGCGGPMTKYAVHCDDNSTSGSSRFFVLTAAEAREWLERWEELDALEEFFASDLVDA